MFYTTLNKIREYHPCVDGWKKLLEHLGKTKADDEPLSFKTILDSNGFIDAMWVLRFIKDAPEVRLFAVRCVRQVQHMIKNTDLLDALDIAERFAVGDATDEDLDSAYKKAARMARESFDLLGYYQNIYIMVMGVTCRDASEAAWYSSDHAACAYAYSRVALDKYNPTQVYGMAWDQYIEEARDDQEKDFIAIFCS